MPLKQRESGCASAGQHIAVWPRLSPLSKAAHSPTPPSRPSGAGQFDLFQASRPHRNSDFANLVNLRSVNSRHDDRGASLTPDGLTLLFESDRSGGSGKTDIWVGTRATRDVEFGPPHLVSINTPETESGPCLSFDGQTLFFHSDRPGGLGKTDIWMIRRVLK